MIRHERTHTDDDERLTAGRGESPVSGTDMKTMSLRTRVAAAKALLEEIPAEHDGLRAEQMANLQEAIEFLNRLETSFRDEGTDD